MFGGGFPVALQNNMTSSVSFAVALWEMKSIDGGPKTKQILHQYF